ncbi:MAG TPA: DUF1702 family protein [Terriglobia bacterium]|nr:DUF1702 family protein [Terriglobia bacterium]
MRSFRSCVLGIAPGEATFASRGFHGRDPQARRHLEQIGSTFLEGYNAALACDELDALGCRLNSIDANLRGFAFEGAAMSLSLLDHLTLWDKHRLQRFLDGPGSPHVYMLHVGAGWALARLPWTRLWVERRFTQLDPLLKWLALDGYAFHEGYFHWKRCLGGDSLRGTLSPYSRRVFDQGLGRALWFVGGADIDYIAETIATFQPPRRKDLWRGVGLACAYAGGVGRAVVDALAAVAKPYAPQLAQGAAFAAKARERAGNPAECTDIACEVLCGVSTAEAAAVTDAALVSLPEDGPEPAYEVWQRRIQARFAGEKVGELKS